MKERSRKTPKRRERLKAKMSEEQKELLVQETGIETSQRHEIFALSERDSLAFAQALMDPPAPNERHRAAAQRHRDLIDE